VNQRLAAKFSPTVDVSATPFAASGGSQLLAKWYASTKSSVQTAPIARTVGEQEDDESQSQQRCDDKNRRKPFAEAEQRPRIQRAMK